MKAPINPLVGPWKVSSKDQARGAVVRSASGHFVAECSPSDNIPELIAAAPELLSAVKLALGIAESHIRSEYEGTAHLVPLMASLDPVRAAIKTAEGET